MGLPALVSALLATEGAAQSDPVLSAPQRLKAGEEWIDTGKEIAHAGPQLHDVDGDGLQDLVVGNFAGHFQVYRNVGTRTAPAFESRGRLKAAGVEAKVPNW
jgi:hypothetical protein